MKYKFFIILCLFLAVFSGALLYSQEITGELNGKVLLEGGAALPGVRVMATSTNLVGKKVTITDDTGAYRLPMLPPGTYKLTFTLEGFKTVVRDKIVLEVGKVLKINIVLQTGELEETVDVSGSAPLIDVRQSSTASNITKETFAKLPKGRNFTSVMANQAGVNKEGRGHHHGSGENYFFNGASSAENTFFVDGTNTTSLTSGNSGQRVDMDNVEEVQIKSAGYSAEYGGSMGGVISVITKSGGNEFHGDLSFYYDADWLRKKDRAPLIRDFDDKNRLIYDEGRLKDKYQRLEPSLSLGGYVLKDKLWFFSNFSPSFAKTKRKYRYVYDRAKYKKHEGEEFSRIERRYKGSVKLTAALTNNIRFNIGGTLDWQKNLRDLPSTRGTSKYTPEKWADAGSKRPKITLSGGLDWTPGHNSVLNITGGYYRTNSYDCSKNKPTNPPIRVYFYNSNKQLNPGPDLVREKEWENISWRDSRINKKDISIRIQSKADFIHYLNSSFGEHVFKTGFGWSRQKLDILKGSVNEYWRLYWRNDDTGENTKYSGQETTYGYARTYQSGKNGKTHNDVFTLYLQDSWTINGNFTLNVGVRTEKEKMPTFSNKFKTAFKFDFLDKIAPRVGFSWDINGDGKNKVFASFGIYYDVMKLYMAIRSFGAETEYQGYYDIVTLDWRQYLDTLGPTWDKSKNPDDPILGGKKFSYVNRRRISDPETMVQPDIKPFSKLEVSFGYSRMLSDKISCTITGIYNTVLNAIENIGIQRDGGDSFYIGNPGSKWIREQFKPGVNPDVPDGYQAPKAKRHYRSVKIELKKKWANHWFGGLSCTLSRLTGNFSGLKSTDRGRGAGPMVNGFFDTWYLHLKQDLTPSDGLLPTDRPVDIRVYGAYSFDFGLTIGTNAYFKSGTPITRFISINHKSGYAPNGRGTLGRNPSVFNVDLNIEQKFNISDKVRFSIGANINNLTNNTQATVKSGSYNDSHGSVIEIPNEVLKAGYDIDEVMKQQGTKVNLFYLKKDRFRSPISAELRFKLSF